MPPRTRLRLEPLEARRTPATMAADHRTVTFTDADGDAATVVFSQPVLTTQAIADAVFHFDVGGVDGVNAAPQQLQQLDLTVAGLPAGLSVTAKATAGATGNGRVDVGWVNAGGKDVGVVNISGDLGRVTAGDATTRTPGLRALTVGSLGVRGPATQEAGGSLASVVTGALGSLTVATDVTGASVSVTGGADGKVGVVRIGGSLTADPATAGTGLITATGNIGPVTIGGNLTGGGVGNSGLSAGGTLGPVTVKGDVAGGAGDDSGSIVGALGIRGLTVGKSVTGGAGARSAAISTAGGSIGRVSIAGALAGKAGANSASIHAAASIIGDGGKIASVTVKGEVSGVGPDSGSIVADAGIGPVHLGALTGGANDYSAAITAVTGITSVTIDGDLTGGLGKHSASVQVGKVRSGPAKASGSLGPVKVGGNLTGGTGDYSAAIQAYSTPVGNKTVGGKIAVVTVVGDLTGGNGNYSATVDAQDRIGRVTVGSGKAGGNLTGDVGRSSAAISAFNGIGAVTVRGDVTGGVGDYSASINTNGKLGPVTVLANTSGNHGDVTGGDGKLSASVHGLSIARVSIAGTVTGGQGVNGASILADRTLGPVVVSHDWFGASIAAGVDPGADGHFGTGNEARTFAGVITSITIKGQVNGTGVGFPPADHFAFTAAWVRSVKVGGVAVALTRGPGNDTAPGKSLGTTGDFVVVELAPGP